MENVRHEGLNRNSYHSGEQNGKQGQKGREDQADLREESTTSGNLVHDRQGIVIKEAQGSHQIEEDENQFVLHSSGEEDADEIEWER